MGDAPDQMIGLKLGNYEITEKIAQGGMGLIYKARHETLNRTVAIKFLASHLSEEKEYVERFLREARASAVLNHPNIVGVYDAGVSEKVYYLVMEHVNGRDIASLMKEGAVYEEAACIRYILQAAVALAFAHKAGIIHQDVKPQNLILTDDGQIKVCDLGLATLLSEKSDALLGEGEVIGTPYYLSPEQIRDAKSVDARTDIYSLGATFYHLACGVPPYLGEDNQDIMTRHLEEPFPSPRKIKAGLSEGVCYVLEKMMAKDVATRYQSMEEVQRALEMLDAGQSPIQKVISGIAENEEVYQGKLALLERRFLGNSEFPSLAGTMNVINKLLSVTDNTSVNELADAILSDFALTNKILKLVNSVFYGGFGEKIATVSEAVMVLGLGQVRNAALSLMLFENLHKGAQAEDIKESSISNYLSGVIGKNIAEKLAISSREEAFICSIFHNLGKLLVTFYLPEDRVAINELMAKDASLTDDMASRMVLGKSYEYFGIHVGKAWNFPEQILSTMERIPEGEVPHAETVADQLHAVVSYANDLCSLLRNMKMGDEEREGRFQALTARFTNRFVMTPELIWDCINTSLEELSSFAGSLDMQVDIKDAPPASPSKVAGSE